LWPDQFLNGYGQGKIESARLAAEADELMREMAEHILELIDAIETDDIVYESIVERHLARETLDKYNNWKEQTNER
jgi:uncharacterized protein YgfB (UPF0149 family)